MDLLTPLHCTLLNNNFHVHAGDFRSFVKPLRGGVAQWVARLTRNVEVVGMSPTKGPRCFIEQETLLLLLSTGSSQERIRA